LRISSTRGSAQAPLYGGDAPLWWSVGLLLAAALVAQSALAPWISLRGATPALVLLVVLWYAQQSGTLGGLLFGLIAGAAEDALSPGTAPAWTFATAVVGALWGRLAHGAAGASRLWLVTGVALATLVRWELFSLAGALAGHPAPLALTHFHAALYQCALDAALALVAISLFPSLVRRV